MFIILVLPKLFIIALQIKDNYKRKREKFRPLSLFLMGHEVTITSFGRSLSYLKGNGLFLLSVVPKYISPIAYTKFLYLCFIYSSAPWNSFKLIYITTKELVPENFETVKKQIYTVSERIRYAAVHCF
jgi:hypothetical protein